MRRPALKNSAFDRPMLRFAFAVASSRWTHSICCTREKQSMCESGDSAASGRPKDGTQDNLMESPLLGRSHVRTPVAESNARVSSGSKPEAATFGLRPIIRFETHRARKLTSTRENRHSTQNRAPTKTCSWPFPLGSKDWKLGEQMLIELKAKSRGVIHCSGPANQIFRP